MEKLKINCSKVINGNIRSELISSNESFSFVGGVNIKTGEISDYRHPNYKENIKDKVFAFPFGRGSSGAGLVLMEMDRIGTAPAAIINVRTDPVILSGPLIIKHFYNHIIPIINVNEEDYNKLIKAKEVEILEDKDYINVYF